MDSYTVRSDNSARSAHTSGNEGSSIFHPAPASCNVVASYAMNAAEIQAKTESYATSPFTIRLTKNLVRIPLVPGSVLFKWGGEYFYDMQGSIFASKDPNTGTGVLRGSIDYLTGVVTLDVYDSGDNTLEVLSLAGRLGSQYVTQVEFRTPGIPVRPGSFTISGVTMHGERFTATANENGEIIGSGIQGTIDTDMGIVSIGFGELVDNLAEYTTEDWYNDELVTPEGKVWKPELVYADSITYGCVVYSYIPLDADLLGINPVRLPVDGKVPIVKAGNIVVIHNTQQQTVVSSLVAGAIINLSRPADSVELYDSSEPPLRIPATMYSHSQGDSQVIIDTVNNDFSPYTLPLVVAHKIEDMALVSGTQINGQISLSQGTKNAYPADGTLVSSALLFGDLKARAYNLFDQKTWDNVFSDDLNGNAATGTYNSIDYPIEIFNSGAVNERWALVFDTSESFRVIGEQRGMLDKIYTIGDGEYCEPTNTATGKAYWRLRYEGFGTGWIPGNVIRFNTDGAAPPAWIVRTTQQGEETEPEDFFVIQPRGDAA